ncbi:MAG: TIGR03915 family putative DNA repair protein [Treponema sp.]|nr:TIGR03915 family putative DNA repair protein [Treponema sp.]
MFRKLNELFLLINNKEPIRRQEDLFGFSENAASSMPEAAHFQYEQDDIDLIASFYSGMLQPSNLPEPTRTLFNLSVNAFEIFIHSWMSEIPIERESVIFAKKIIAASVQMNSQEEKHRAAEQVINDRGDSDTLTMLNVSARVTREIHRMTELLRFSPDADGVFIAKCAPDHLVLPALGIYFTARFSETAWAIIDEKRNLCLCGQNGKQAKIMISEDIQTGFKSEGNDDWEALWKHYHRTINNESRDNPNLQRQLMPRRYWKYLPEKT